MKTYKRLFETLCSWNNLEDAYWKARKHKSNNPKVQEFEKHWRLHLATLHRELKTKTYTPRPLRKFILRDPKTRTICVSDFRDRIVHHALINILQPIFEPRFIYDSYASRKGKGTLPALKRFETFMRKATKNGKLAPGATNANAVKCFAFKADIKHYFETVDHDVLQCIIRNRVKDENVLWLVKTILGNNPHDTSNQGMPLGNWTSQFFANVYLNELDQFVKHTLKAKYYIRYVDDFVMLHHSKTTLQEWQQVIAEFLRPLKLELHPNKCTITSLSHGVSFLGFRCFYRNKLVRQRNIRKILNKLRDSIDQYASGMMSASDVLETWQGWNAYAMHGNTHHLRKRMLSELEQQLITITTARKLMSR
jgi:retron-type reverse transcriptase